MAGISLTGVAVIGGLVLLVIFVAVVFRLAWWMLEPINRAAGALEAPTRFMLIDFVSLMILLQVGLAICGQALSANDTSDAAASMYWTLLGVVALLVLVLWGASVSVVSRAGILRPLRRVLVIVVLVPGTLATIMGAPFLIFFLAGGIAGRFRPEPEVDWMQRQLPWLALAAVGVPIAVFVLRRLSFWSLSGSKYAAHLESANPIQPG
jgi:hypothetical protein